MTKRQMEYFFSELEGKNGCNFRKNSKGEIIWKCKGGQDTSISRKILKEMKINKTEVDAFLKECEGFGGFGGFCDCEVIFNSRTKILSQAKKPKEVKK